MGRGRKKEKRSQLAGERFKIAKTIFGKSYEKLVTNKRWEKIVEIYDLKTVRGWVRKGLPLRRVSAVAEYFGVPGHYFTDERVDTRNFEREVHLAKNRLENPNAESSVLKEMKKKEEYSIEHLLWELSECASKWFDKGCPYEEIENSYKKYRLYLNNKELIKKVEDPKIKIFLMDCALHAGKNWAYWVQCNLSNDRAIKHLIRVMSDIGYDRPRLRILYALQQFPQDQIIENMEGTTNPDVIKTVKEYVAKKKVVEFIEKQREKIPQKANEVLKELVRLWGEQVPGFGLFGVEQSLLSELERIKVIDAITSNDLVNISKKPGMNILVIDFLKKAMSKPDPAERYWIYTTLGLIGSDRAIALVEEGLKDGNEFARSGAERAMDIINDNSDSKGGKNEK